MAKLNAWNDEELQVLLAVTDGLGKLDRKARLRVLRYVCARLEMPLLFLDGLPERCEEIEEIEPPIYFG